MMVPIVIFNPTRTYTDWLSLHDIIINIYVAEAHSKIFAELYCVVVVSADVIGKSIPTTVAEFN